MPQNVATISSSVSSRAAAGPNQRRRKSSDGGPGQRDHPDGHPGTSWPTMGARGAMLRSSRREWLQPPRGGRRQTRRFVPKASRPRQRACWAPWAEAFAVRPSPLSAYLTQACQCTIPTAGGVQQRLRDEGGRGNVAAWKCAAAAFRRRLCVPKLGGVPADRRTVRVVLVASGTAECPKGARRDDRTDPSGCQQGLA